MDNFEKAVSASKSMSSKDGAGHRVINHHTEYLNGQLYVICFEDSENNNLYNYVYIEGDEVIVCKNEALLNELVSRKSKKSNIKQVLDGIGGVAGIIGLIITLTIVYLVLSDPKVEIPQILSAALTTILGFYFGSITKK